MVVPAPRFTQEAMKLWPKNPSWALLANGWKIVVWTSPFTLQSWLIIDFEIFEWDLIKQLSPINTGPLIITNGSIIAELEIKTGPFDSSITTFSIFEHELSISLKNRSILAIHCHGNLRLSSRLYTLSFIIKWDDIISVSYTHLTLPTIPGV